MEWGWWKDSHTLHIFLFLLINANFRENTFLGYKIFRGQCIIGRKTLSENTGMSERAVRTSLKHLKLTSEITIKTTNRFSIITICNYDKYNPSDFTSDQQDNSSSDQQVTSKRPASDQQVTTPREGKKDKNNTYTSEFESFWAAYPKKSGKGAAWKSWRKIPKEAMPFIMDALKWQIKSEQWTINHGQFIPMPSTYLNQSRWEDQPIKIEQLNSYIPLAYRPLV